MSEQVLSFKAKGFKKERPEGIEAGLFILRGVWHFLPDNSSPVFSIYRNELKGYRDKIENQHLPLIWSDETPFNQEKDSDSGPKFYQIEAQLISSLGCLEWVRNLAEPFNPPPPFLEETAKFRNKKPKKSKTDEEKSPVDFEKEIRMTDARAEITLKFNTIPEVRELPKSRVEFYLKATTGVVFTVNIKGKAWRKAEASMKEFPSFVAMVGGKLGAPTSKGFEVEGGGLQVFEKKPKEPKEPKEVKEEKEAIATTTTDKITA